MTTGNNAHKLIQEAVFILVGVWTLLLSRSAFRRPEDFIKRWYRDGYIVPWLVKWTPFRLHLFVIVWIWGSLVMIGTGIAAAAEMPTLGWAVLGGSALMTYFFIPRPNSGSPLTLSAHYPNSRQ